MYISHRSSLLLALLILCSSLLPTVSAAQENVLLDGESIFLTTGELWTFDQGYALRVKSVNQGTNEVWLELSLDGKVLREGIFREKEKLIYSRDKEILNITLDTIYSSPGGELVTFTPVYQYLDPQLPAPQTDDTGQDQSDQEEEQVPADSATLPIPGIGTVGTLMGIALASYFTFLKDIRN